MSISFHVFSRPDNGDEEASEPRVFRVAFLLLRYSVDTAVHTTCRRRCSEWRSESRHPGNGKFILFNLMRMSHMGIFSINIPVTNTRTILLIYFVLVLYYLTHVCNRTYFIFFSKFLKRLTNFTMYHDIIKKT